MPVLELPTDYVRPVTQSYRGAVEQVTLSSPLSDGLRKVSKHTGATLYMVLLAAFKVLLSRYTGQEEIIVKEEVERVTIDDRVAAHRHSSAKRRPTQNESCNPEVSWITCKGSPIRNLCEVLAQIG